MYWMYRKYGLALSRSAFHFLMRLFTASEDASDALSKRSKPASNRVRGETLMLSETANVV